MDWLGLGHFYTALAAIATGAVVVFQRKGTKRHKWIGRAYFLSMVLVNISALMIYDLFGHFGPFHVAAIISLFSVLMGVVVAWRRNFPQWRIAHAYWMSWSYVGLLAAAVAESATRFLDFHFGWTVAMATFAVVFAGAIIINRKLPRMLGLVKT